MRIAPAVLLFLGPPFGLLLVGLLIFGIGTGISDVGWNSWASQLPRANIAQGLLHGSFAFGAVSGPVAAAALVEAVGWTYLFGLVVGDPDLNLAARRVLNIRSRLCSP